MDRNAFQAARKQYETLLQGKPFTTPPTAAASAAAAPASAASAPASSTRLAQALAKLQAAFDKVKGLDDKYSLQFISTQRIDAITSFLGTLENPKGADDPNATDLDRQARALQMLDSTYATWVTDRAKAKEVLTRPLLMQQALDELTKESTTRSIAADAAKVEVQKTRVTLLLQQASHFDSANKYLVRAGDFTRQSMRTVMLGKDTDSGKLMEARYSIAQAAAHYGHATGYLQSQLHATDLQDVALDNAQELDLAELNVRQWDTLIDTNVNLVAAWAATGVKSDTIGQAVNAALLLFIGVGVN